MSSSSTIFGPIVTGGDVETWAMNLLRKWFSTYLAEVERQHGYSGHDLPRPKGWAIGPTWDKWPEDQLPAVIVSSRGVPVPPAKNGDRGYRARWLLDPGVICSARTQAETHALAMLYGAAVRALVIQRPSLDGHAEAADWIAESYDDLGYDDTRSLYAVRQTFSVEVLDVTFGNAGPTEPDVPLEPDDTLPWPPWQEVATVAITVEQNTVDNPLPEEDRP